ncbi:FAD:protein FMN transferase [Stenotrophomonas sp. W1S232]|uniref:FAD:protein FMN transferase n=1 Tax=Stenotrophomonas koreensis TaxID=266128 RepID=A0A7W3UYF4_9GAMM|nr:FAD:protein FMN transferase [Stenotrophomonas koreensis]MBB1116159.1 FAD:protein FMN transferase [Stenotrophomonas koreensis]
MDQAQTIATLGGHSMGTTWSVRLCVAPGRDLRALHDGIHARLNEIIVQMSTWQADSLISRFNRADAGSAFALPGEFAEVLACALQVAASSDGAFDPTIGPLVALWGFGADAGGQQRPNADQLQATRARCGWQRLHWQPGQPLVQPGGLALDFSAIAKGYAVDHLSAWLRHCGITAALVEVGGELHGYGRKPDGSPWRVLVETGPEEDDAATWPPRVLTLDDRAVATSGDHFHHYADAQGLVSHSLDPRSGQPVAMTTAAVSVAAASAMLADAWATALTVLGPQQGLPLANAHGLAARFVSRHHDGPHEHLSTAFAALLEDNATENPA